MGMYDIFFIDYPLPIEAWVPDKYRSAILQSFSADGFQSKSLDCSLNNYYICNNGHIYLDEISCFELNEPIKREKIYFHGHIFVYTFILLDEESSVKDSPSLWFEYNLKFTDSLLVSAIMVSPTKEQIDGLYSSL